jgi:hypothetical protein
MEPRYPSSSSALPVRRNEIRRRSGGLSPKPEDDRTTSSSMAYSPSFRGARYLKPVPDPPEDDTRRSRSATLDSLNSFPAFPNLGLPVEMREECAPAILLIPPKGREGSRATYSGLFHSSEATKLRAETPLPPLPEEANCQKGNEVPFSSIPLTPRPESSRCRSQDSQASKASQRSIFSLFPRLPTPDFTGIKRNPLHQSIVTPLNFLRAHTPSLVSTPPVLSRQSSVHATSIKNTGTTESSGSFKVASARSKTFRRHIPHADSFKSASWSETSSTLCDDELYSFFVATAPPRFTRKFPSPASTSAFGRSLSKSDALETLVASESGNDLGFERVGSWTGYKWCLLFSVLTVSTRAHRWAV